jgi:hypothetical protein
VPDNVAIADAAAEAGGELVALALGVLDTLELPLALADAALELDAGAETGAVAAMLPLALLGGVVDGEGVPLTDPAASQGGKQAEEHAWGCRDSTNLGTGVHGQYHHRSTRCTKRGTTRGRA